MCEFSLENNLDSTCPSRSFPTPSLLQALLKSEREQMFQVL
jgi:hypothetical protein